MITLLTATGARPEAWAFCERWMAAQQFAGPVRWVIVDDGPTPQSVTLHRERWNLEVIRPTPLWRPGENTQARNLCAGLEVITPEERVVVIEDDDYYAPDWLTHVTAALERALLVGETCARYYNIPKRCAHEHTNTTHSSLCSTAMRGRALRLFRDVCAYAPLYLDIYLWGAMSSRELFGGHRVIGMKGLPGRHGIGSGHQRTFTGMPDPDGVILREWIGGDAEIYLTAPATRRLVEQLEDANEHMDA
jgi:hypothetical protein